MKGYRYVAYNRDFLNAEFKLVVYPYFSQSDFNVDANNMFLTHEKPFHNKNKLRVSFHVNILSKTIGTIIQIANIGLEFLLQI